MVIIFFLNSLLKRVLSSGAHQAGALSRVRSIQLTNAIALIAATLFMVLVTYMFARSGWSMVTLVGALTITTLLSVIVLNYFHWYNLSRGIMCVIIPLAVLAAIFLPRIVMIGQYTYFRSPEVYSILITCSVIPMLIFSLREKKALLGGLLINVLILLLFDISLYRFSSSNEQ